MEKATIVTMEVEIKFVQGFDFGKQERKAFTLPINTDNKYMILEPATFSAISLKLRSGGSSMDK